ncbi:unnamed protein product [Fusarium graminearum]|nr:unnamed protein product [Fusarium graminearum]
MIDQGIHEKDTATNSRISLSHHENITTGSCIFWDGAPGQPEGCLPPSRPISTHYCFYYYIIELYEGSETGDT